MFRNRNKICILIVLLSAAVSIPAQAKFNEIGPNVTKTLLKKDLRLAIKEAESSSANDLASLFWRLSLYRRAVNIEKVASTVRQIITAADAEKNRYAISEQVRYPLKDQYFKDPRTLQLYLQFYFDGEVYGKLVDLCSENRQSCDIGGFDDWLEQKARENPAKADGQDDFWEENSHWSWVARRIDWRERFGLDNGEILNRFVEDLRKDPANLDAALRYIQFFKDIQDINWLADTFASEQAADYYDLAQRLSQELQMRPMLENEWRQIYQITERLLRKSLSLPFNNRDISLMYSRHFRYASVDPQIKDPEKQLRFWTKTELAEVLKNLGRPQDAQPIVEELMSMDTTGIQAYKPSRLAGMVQAGSGARVVESKILLEQATRQDSYEYWRERVEYYLGRKEPDRAFDAYLQSFAAVPFDLSSEESRESRMFQIRRFAEFAAGDYRYHRNLGDEDHSAEEKRVMRFGAEAESFLKNEFEKTRSNIGYSYGLAETISGEKFKKLTEEILVKNPGMFMTAAENDLLGTSDGLLYRFFKSETISQEKKDLVFAQLLKVAEKKGVREAWVICDAINTIDERPTYAARVVPVLQKNLKIAEGRIMSSRLSSDDDSTFEDLRWKYSEILFDTHLAARDWRSAERMLATGQIAERGDYSIRRLVRAAAQNGAFDDAFRYWKIKANLNRSDLEDLNYLKGFPPFADSLRGFYKQMKIDEPYSPIPDVALGILR